MDLQKELNEWADLFIPHDSKDFRDALELNSFHQLNVEKLLALNGVSEAYVFRKKDSWKAWYYAKYQAEHALLEQFEINNKLVEQIEELKAKAQAVPDGFVLVSQKELLELVIAINAVDLATHTGGKPNEVREMWQQVALKLGALCSTGAS